MTNSLLIYPEFPPSYWSGKYALEFIGRQSSMPPLGLITIARMFPAHHQLKLLDMNVEPLTEDQLRWADYVFLSAMIVQRESFSEVVRRCNKVGVPVIAGGPFPTSFYEEIEGVDYLFLGEAEERFEAYLEQIEAGRAPHICESPRNSQGLSVKPAVTGAPLPRFDLLPMQAYGSMAVQFSRGCPFDCEFCDITKLYGRVPRTKSHGQMIAELTSLYECGWRGAVFLVDDNFIGNKRNARNLLPEIAQWQRSRGYPFRFYTEASVNLAQMPDLMQGMVDAGFDMVFLGLESPNPAALKKTNKVQNISSNDPDYLLRVVRTIQGFGLEVTAGFIVGLDGDDESIFDSQFEFIQTAGIPTAMVGLLTALKGTNLYERLKREGRLLAESTGNNVSAVLNFVPEIDRVTLLQGYQQLLSRVYDRSLQNYFERCFRLFCNLKYQPHTQRRIGWPEVRAVLLSIWRQVFSVQGWSYLRFLTRVMLLRPVFVPEAIRLAIMGYHFERITRQQVAVDDFNHFLENGRAWLQQAVSQLTRGHGLRWGELRAELQALQREVQARYRKIGVDYRVLVDKAWRGFQENYEAILSKYQGMSVQE